MMHAHPRLGLGAALAAFALSLALAAPASADHWHGHGMYHGGCYGPGAASPHGMHGDCPYMHGMARMTPASGKTLGVLVSDLSNAGLDEQGLGYGVKVNKVQPDSAAAAAGIQAGDLIVEFAGKPVTSGDRLRWLVRQAEAGKGVDIKLLRDKQSVTLNATLAEPAPKGKCEDKPAPRLGT
jgi:S1-C subfamily serine protease